MTISLDYQVMTMIQPTLFKVRYRLTYSVKGGLGGTAWGSVRTAGDPIYSNGYAQSWHPKITTLCNT